MTLNSENALKTLSNIADAKLSKHPLLGGLNGPEKSECTHTRLWWANFMPAQQKVQSQLENGSSESLLANAHSNF